MKGARLVARLRSAAYSAALLLVAVVPLPAQRVKLLVPMDSLIERARRDSDDAPAHYEVALGYWLGRKYDLAEQHLRQAIAIDPRLAQAYLALSLLPYARRFKLWDEEEDGKVPAEWQAAVEEADRFGRLAFLIDPMVDLKPLALMIPPPGVFGLSGSRQAAYTYVMNGFGSFWDGQYGRAYQFFREIAGPATEADRQKFSSWFLWYEALAAAHTSDFARAEADLRLLMARADTTSSKGGSRGALAFTTATQYRYALACLLDDAGRSREAVPLLQEALTSDAGLYVAHLRLATIYDDTHRTQSALTERRRAMESNPDDPSLPYELGEALARAGELAEAHTVLRQAIQANPRNVRALYVLGYVAAQVGEKEEARSAYERFLALAPSRFETQKTEVEGRLQALK